jgi:hypothetical protein
MRDDMSKVIVERPRKGSRSADSRRGRIHRASEDVSSKIGIKHGIEPSKYLNENLSPLKRFIASQVNRPWDKVYSEICANIDRRNTVQEHIFTHIENFVALHGRLVDGEVYIKPWTWSAEWVPLDESNTELYVHPRTGILLKNRHREGRIRRGREKRDAQAAQVAQRRRVLGEEEQLLLIDDIWYLVKLAPLPAGVSREVVDRGKRKTIVEYERRWDMVRKRKVSADEGPGEDSNGPSYLYGRRGVYALSKQQLGERELKKYGLKQKGRDFRPFCFLGARRAHGRRCLERVKGIEPSS